jgi:outer membrane biogenesis lipoprotein LolB
MWYVVFFLLGAAASFLLVGCCALASQADRCAGCFLYEQFLEQRKKARKEYENKELNG